MFKITDYMNNKLLFLFLIFSISAFSQKRENRIDEEFSTPVSFPYDFLGNYAGNLRVSNNTGVINNVPTEFSITETDVEGEFYYSIAYLKGKLKEVVDYRLYTIDQKNGFYAIKDSQGLEFTATLIDNTLYSTFEINNNILFTGLEFTNSGKVRLTIYLSEKINNKRSKKLKIDEAKSANVMLIQKAVLSKK